MGKTAANMAREAPQDDPPTDDNSFADTAPAADAARDDFTPRLRILNRQSWRGSFRLEQVFWSILEEAAEASGKRLNEYVHGLLAAAPEGVNKSSLLRAHAAKWLRRRARATSGLPQVVANAVAACPAPCFVMDADGRIQLYNRAFTEFLRDSGIDTTGSMGVLREPGADGQARPPSRRNYDLSFEKPLPEIMDALRTGPAGTVDCSLCEDGRAVACTLHAQAGARVLKARARICLLADGPDGFWRAMVFVVG